MVDELGLVAPAASLPVPRRPDQLLEFRLGRMLILLCVLPGLPYPKTLHLERLGYYDFFADNPFLIFNSDSVERSQLLLAGFTETNLSYNSAAQRFTNRRARLQHDLGLLVARGLTSVEPQGRHIAFALLARGSDLASELRSFYARGYRVSAELVGRALNKLSDAALADQAKEWLRAEPFMIDLYEEAKSS
jgi:hypothetical protein